MKRITVIGMSCWLLLSAGGPVAGRQAPDWPRKDAPLKILIEKSAGEEMEDPVWAHLHQGMPGADRVSFKVTFRADDSAVTPPEQIQAQLRYLVRGTPVSGWLDAPFTWTLTVDSPGLPALDGIHDISVDARGVDRLKLKPIPIFLHLARGRAVDETVPLMGQDHQYGNYTFHWGSGVEYIRYADVAATRGRAFPVSGDVARWSQPPITADLYQEEMAPHADLFMGVQMWWEEPPGGPNAGLKFPRALVPKFDEDILLLRTVWHQDKLPFTDGPRGVAWTSPYTGGQVGADGTLYFVEKGGPFRMMRPDGEVLTIAGWRVRSDRDPVWITKPIDQIRANMELRGVWREGQYPDRSGFRTPTDVAIDPKNPRVFYITGFEDHVIWKVDTTPGFDQAVVTVLAGDPNHAPGYRDGVGHQARFFRPISLVFDPVADVLYVAEQDNHTIRKVTRTGAVTTAFGRPGQLERALASGVPAGDSHQAPARARSRYTVSASEAANGVRPDLYFPQTVRVTSTGDLIELSLGFGSVRRINSRTGETRHLADVWQRMIVGGGGTYLSRGWAWLDVDRFGNSGPLDGIYLTTSQSSRCHGETDRAQANESWCWLPADGSAGPKFLFNDWDPYPDGWGRLRETDPPHYGWMAAVDPRGAVYLAGMGEHGITRLRFRRQSDPVVTDHARYMRAKLLWRWGCAGDGRSVATPALKHGWEGHNYLGFEDAWAIKGRSAAEIARAMSIPAACSSAERSDLVWFLALNGQHVANLGPSASRRR